MKASLVPALGLLVLTSLHPGLALAQISPNPLSEDRDWARIVRGFRRDHNFAFSLGYSRDIWQVSTKRTPNQVDFGTSAFDMQFGYSFHLPLAGSLGYLLGTQAAISFVEYDGSRLKIARTYVLPGIECGLVWNVNENWRLLGTFTYGWQRMENLLLNLEQGQEPEKVAVTGDTKSYRLMFDYFFQLSWAVRIESETSHFSYGAKERVDLQKQSRTLRIGLVKHLI